MAGNLRVSGLPHSPSMRLIDLSHPLVRGQLGFPDDPSLAIEAVHTVASKGYHLSKITMSSHQGTHLDAPYHFFDEGATLDQMPLEKFYGPAHLVDLAPGTALPPATPLTVDHFAPFDSVFHPGARVIYRTGWSAQFGTADYFEAFPTLTLDAARWIAGRGIMLLGMDTPTPSVQWLECHHILLGRGTEIVIVESLTNLDRLPEQFVFIGFPLNFAGRDGSPIRAVAMVPE